jgi:hypothetical protein
VCLLVDGLIPAEILKESLAVRLFKRSLGIVISLQRLGWLQL